MELRILKYEPGTWWRQAVADRRRDHLRVTDGEDDYVLVFQYRDGPTHDAPWIDVSIVDAETLC
jgi:hypothetical protein